MVIALVLAAYFTGVGIGALLGWALTRRRPADALPPRRPGLRGVRVGDSGPEWVRFPNETRAA